MDTILVLPLTCSLDGCCIQHLFSKSVQEIHTRTQEVPEISDEEKVWQREGERESIKTEFTEAILGGEDGDGNKNDKDKEEADDERHR